MINWIWWVQPQTQIQPFWQSGSFENPRSFTVVNDFPFPLETFSHAEVGCLLIEFARKFTSPQSRMHTHTTTTDSQIYRICFRCWLILHGAMTVYEYGNEYFVCHCVRPRRGLQSALIEFQNRFFVTWKSITIERISFCFLLYFYLSSTLLATNTKIRQIVLDGIIARRLLYPPISSHHAVLSPLSCVARVNYVFLIL